MLWSRSGCLRSGNQSELARFCGLSPQAVQKWISGETAPRGKNLIKAAEFLGVSPIELQFGEKQNHINVASANIGIRKIPLISYVQAGDWIKATNSYQVGNAH